MYSDNSDREVMFEILEHIGVLSTFSTGWRKELNLVSWNGSAGKYDIREWDPSHERMSRGITLKENEMRVLLDVMRRRRGASSRSGDRSGPMRIPEGFRGVDDEGSIIRDVSPDEQRNHTQQGQTEPDKEAAAAEQNAAADDAEVATGETATQGSLDETLL